jgi:hypothetical protein
MDLDAPDVDGYSGRSTLYRASDRAASARSQNLVMIQIEYAMWTYDDIIGLLIPEMRAYERPHRLYFARDGHWSPADHAAVAEILAEQLSELRLLGSPDRGRQAEHRSGPGKVSHVLHAGGAPEEEP